MPKHTPGPWTRNQYGSILGADGQKVKATGLSLAMYTDDEVEANASLIAAAPSMLTCLHDLDEMWSQDGYRSPESAQSQAQLSDRAIDVWRRVRAAIAKAESDATHAKSTTVDN